MKLHDILDELDEWLKSKIEQHEPMDNISASTYLNAYRSVQYKIDELKEKHE